MRAQSNPMRVFRFWIGDVAMQFDFGICVSLSSANEWLYRTHTDRQRSSFEALAMSLKIHTVRARELLPRKFLCIEKVIWSNERNVPQSKVIPKRVLSV